MEQEGTALQITWQRNSTKTAEGTAGLAQWLLDALRGMRSRRQVAARQMQLLETLPLGGRRQLMLVSCGGERFLVGGGADSIETIVRVHNESAPDSHAATMDGPCL